MFTSLWWEVYLVKKIQANLRWGRIWRAKLKECMTQNTIDWRAVPTRGRDKRRLILIWDLVLFWSDWINQIWKNYTLNPANKHRIDRFPASLWWGWNSLIAAASVINKKPWLIVIHNTCWDKTSLGYVVVLAGECHNICCVIGVARCVRANKQTLALKEDKKSGRTLASKPKNRESYRNILILENCFVVRKNTTNTTGR